MLKTITLFLCAGLICLSASADEERAEHAYDGPKEDLHLYLLIGQSNMAGRAPIDEQSKGVIDRCYLLTRAGVWETASNPLNRHSTIRKAEGMQKLGPGGSFSRTMLKEDKRVSIGLIVNARGGTSIEQWAKGGEFYEEAVRRVKQATETGTLKGILWHQGEADRDNPDRYLEKLKKLIADLREDLQAPELPFIAGQVKDVPEINNQIARLPGEVAFTAVARSEALTTQDRFHFDTKSTKLLGQRYAQALIKLRKSDSSDEDNAKPAGD